MVQTAAENGSGKKAMVQVRRCGRGNWKTENKRNSAGCSGHKPCARGSTPRELIWMNVRVRERIAAWLLEGEEAGMGGEAD